MNLRVAKRADRFPRPDQYVVRLLMETKGIRGQRESCASVSKDGEVSTAMVSFPVASLFYPRDRMSLDIERHLHNLAFPVCQSDKACAAFSPMGEQNPTLAAAEGQGDEDDNGMVCYKGGLAIQQNHQMCDVTSRSLWLFFSPFPFGVLPQTK
jgi:hypothetical protein